MKLWQYIVRRFFSIIPVVFGITVITFFLSHVAGNPVAAYAQTPQQLKNPEGIIKKHHLDEPLLNQYWYYLRDLIKGDWGYSPTAGMDVVDCIKTFFPATVQLAIAAMIVALVAGIPLGIISAVKKGSLIDQAVRVFSIAGVSIPIFWFGLVIQYLFHFFPHQAIGFSLLPNSGYADAELLAFSDIHRYTGIILIDALLNRRPDIFLSGLRHLILPAITLGYAQLAIIVRLTRAGMIDTLQQDFIIFAKAKGLKEKTVWYKHALKNALIPIITYSGYLFARLLAGAVLTETIFAWPGIGRWATRAIRHMDVGAIMGFTLFVGLIYIISNTTVDILYGYVDPRVRLE
ncbi:MAG: ABC transporter permease [Candidatus Korarchaeota archaeon]|nr:ABC transporter permease [Candidatus Korarchaeota archaeon]NIU82760.1 ABC transporter permease subunit [Candidatus Thorarchaeota archaeon]NIW13254.1 ABC transporter permease subunit [Candidatus Thorarchaeota archaeon]NIW51381.1 ABC transporter permease subunit [Candidatus Korarchaeota archaeon]